MAGSPPPTPAARGSTKRPTTEPETCERTGARCRQREQQERHDANRSAAPTDAGPPARGRSCLGPPDAGAPAAEHPAAGRLCSGRARPARGARPGRRRDRRQPALGDGQQLPPALPSTLSRAVFCLKAKPTPAGQAGPDQARRPAGLDVAGQRPDRDHRRRRGVPTRMDIPVCGGGTYPGAGPAPGGEGGRHQQSPRRRRAPYRRPRGRPPAGRAAPPGRAPATPAARRGGRRCSGCTG